jgi:enoyl-CoA hydratase/carnithine racemase
MSDKDARTDASEAKKIEGEVYDEDGFVLVRRNGAVGEVILNRPDKLNATTPTTGDAISRAFKDLSADDNLKVIILRGVGRAFSTGGDVGWLGSQFRKEGEQPHQKPTQRRRLNHDELRSQDSMSILHSSKVVIAEGKGYVLGVALDWFLAADILICAEGTVLGHPPARMIAASGSTLYWMLRLGPALHAEMCLMGRYIRAEEAERRGLVNRVVPAEELEATVTAAAEAISNMPADGLAIGKYSRKVAWEILGVRASQMQSAMAHVLQVQQRIGSDEWHIVREREQYGVKGAFQRRDARFKDALKRFNPFSA